MKFKHQSVRDLAWAVSSPPLISPQNKQCFWPDAAWFKLAYDEIEPLLLKVDEDPTELEDLLEKQKDRRLGKYFETLWYYWFKHHPRYEIIKNNLQVIIDGKTLGEIDFIVLDKSTGQMVHWEVAVKFYLGIGDTSKLENWFGPNLRDRLDLKVSHLVQRQSLISKEENVVQWLREQSIFIDQCAVILKGRLYYPWQPGQADALDKMISGRHSPDMCSAQHEYSWWLSQSQFDGEVGNDEKILTLINQGYLERISTGGVKDFDTKSSVFKNRSNKKIRFPLHVQLCNARHSKDRVFLTEDNWPMKKT